MNKTKVFAIIMMILFVITLSKNVLFTGDVIKSNGLIKISLDKISREATFYNEGNIKYFAVMASDGSIKTAFDACDVCFSQHKGYRQEGAYMVCNNCGNKYPINGLGTENKKGGGCWPGYLPSYIEGDYLVIKESDLDTGRYRF